MIKIEFNQDEINQLRHERYNYPEPRVQRKIDVLLLKSQGIAHKKIAEIIGICPNTLRSYLRDYQNGGLEKLKEVNFYQAQSELNQHRQTLEKVFRLWKFLKKNVFILNIILIFHYLKRLFLIVLSKHIPFTKKNSIHY